MKKPLILLIFLLFTYTHSTGQQIYNHGVFWGRLMLSDKISSKLRWELYLQKRTQNNQSGEANIFKSTQFSSVWFWLNYSFNKNLKLSISPFGYFDSHIYNNSDADSELPGIKEFRWVARLETRQEFKFLNYFNRYSIEYRYRDILSNGVYQPNWRVRYMARVEKPIKGILSKDKPVTFLLSDEVFVQFGPAVQNNPNVFDQNRINVGFSYEVINIKLTISYLNIIQERNSGKAFDNANVLWVIVNFDNLFSQFVKKKVKEKSGSQN